MDEPHYIWKAHETMKPMAQSTLLNYWTTMPRPVSRQLANDYLVKLLRSGVLVQVEPTGAMEASDARS